MISCLDKIYPWGVCNSPTGVLAAIHDLVPRLSLVTLAIHCHPRGFGHGICCNKSSGVDADEGKGATRTAEHQEDSQDN